MAVRGKGTSRSRALTVKGLAVVPREERAVFHCEGHLGLTTTIIIGGSGGGHDKEGEGEEREEVPCGGHARLPGIEGAKCLWRHSDSSDNVFFAWQGSREVYKGVMRLYSRNKDMSVG